MVEALTSLLSKLWEYELNARPIKSLWKIEYTRIVHVVIPCEEWGIEEFHDEEFLVRKSSEENKELTDLKKELFMGKNLENWKKKIANFDIWKKSMHKNTTKKLPKIYPKFMVLFWGNLCTFCALFVIIGCYLRVKRFLEFSSIPREEFHFFPRSSRGIKNRGKYNM